MRTRKPYTPAIGKINSERVEPLQGTWEIDGHGNKCFVPFELGESFRNYKLLQKLEKSCAWKAKVLRPIIEASMPYIDWLNENCVNAQDLPNCTAIDMFDCQEAYFVQIAPKVRRIKAKTILTGKQLARAAYSSIHYTKHCEEIKAKHKVYNKTYHQEHREENNARVRAWYAEHREEMKARDRARATVWTRELGSCTSKAIAKLKADNPAEWRRIADLANAAAREARRKYREEHGKQ